MEDLDSLRKNLKCLVRVGVGELQDFFNCYSKIVPLSRWAISVHTKWNVSRIFDVSPCYSSQH